MKEHPILRLLRPIAQREVWRRAAFSLAATWAIAAVAAALLLQAARHLGIPPLASILAVGVLGLIAGLISFVRALRVPPDLQRTAQTIEAAHPDLNGLLVTTLQQQPGPDGRFSFIQSLALDQALDHARRHTWSRLFPTHRILAAVALQGVAFLAFVAVLVFSPRTPVPPSETAKSPRVSPKVVDGLEVTPGNTELEKGSSLVVLARFGNAPRNADLVVLATNKPEQRVALVRNLADPVFGGAVSDVTNHFDYRVESDAGSSELFHVTVFEYPRLDRSIADITYPDYTQRPKKHIEDTRRVTAVEGSTLDLTLQLNKPVTRAVLQPAGTNLAPIVLATPSNQPIASLAGHVLTTGGTYNLRLVDADGRTNRVSAQFVFEVPPNRPPELKLALPRGDIRPSALEELQFDGTVWDDFGILRYGLGFIRVGADPDLVELGTTVPGNERRSFAHQLRLEELNAQPDQVFGWFVWAEDTGPDGQVRRTSGDIFFGEVRPFEEIFREGEGSGEQQGEQQGESQGNNSPATKLAQLQKQIISATWKLQSRKPSTNAPKTSASRIPSPHQISRIRPIRQISPLTLAAHSGVFAQPARLQPSQPPAQRRPRPAAPSTASYAEDLKVVRQAAEDALDQASSSMEEETDPAKRALWTDAITQMERSIELLDKAAKDPTLLKDALAAEQAAYQTILKLQPRESEVTRRRNQQSQSQSQSENQRNQEQIDELDLTQSENRYETQSQARSPQDEQQREQQQAINRLEELARRQEEMNKRLKELQTALQAADEKKKEELQRELKRLQEEQRQNLADADELQQRMEQPGNQSAMSEQRQQLEQTREDMQKAAEATGEGQVSQALASGTRAQRQLEEMREELRRQNASELNEAARELRAEARDIARAQEEIKRELDAQQNSANKGQKSLEDPTGREKLLEKLTAQQSRLTNLVQRATDLSQKAEGSEPLLSKQLYDTLREVSQEDTTNLKQMREQLLREGQLTRGLRDRLKDSEDSNAKSLEVTRELLRQGLDQPAREAEQRARKNIDTLRQGVEKAANSVLGDDTEALRFAQQELDNAAQQLSQEIAQSQPQPPSEAPEAPQAPDGLEGSVRSVQSVGSPPTPGQEPRQPGEPSQTGQQPGQQPGEPQEPRDPSQQPGQQPGQPSQQPGEPRQPGQPSQPNQPGQPGQQPGQPGQPGQPVPSVPSVPTPAPSPNPQDTPAPPSINDSLQSLLPGSRPRGAQTPSGGEARPLTGNDFTQWSDRLRDVEQLIDSQDLRSEVANARDQARRARIDFNRSKTKPDWAQIELQVLKPLVEVRDQIREELARRASQDPLVPLDRDPVPGRYSELVRRYYEELGKDK